MPRYFAHVAQVGAVKYGQLPGPIGVLEASDKFMPIGEARCIAWQEDGIGVWLLSIGGQPIAGRWIIIDREFKNGNEVRFENRIPVVPEEMRL